MVEETEMTPYSNGKPWTEKHIFTVEPRSGDPPPILRTPGLPSESAKDGPIEATILVNRPLYDQPTAERRFGRPPSPHKKKSFLKKVCIKPRCAPNCLPRFFQSLFPILIWLRDYKIKECLLSDVIAGFTIAILQIPQGMAYGLLASVAAINGLYVSFFPILVYILMGTSRHISLGTFSIISMMIATAADSVMPTDTGGSVNGTVPVDDPLGDIHSRMDVLVVLALITGIFQIAMGVLRLGSLAVLLSDNLVSGFSTGAAFHVAASQFGNLLGVKLPRRSGVFKLLMMFWDIALSTVRANAAAVVLALISIVVLVIVKEFINPKVQPKIKLPLPIDLVLVIVATVVSHFCDFSGRYKMEVMGQIPTGLPMPSVPQMHLAVPLLRHAIIIGVVSYAIALSMGKIFAKKHKYRIRANQELIAMGTANVFCSFFQCYPCAVSVSRSLVQERAGGKTQVAGFVSCLFILVVLLFFGPFLYHLPKCILACIILVALKGMFLQFSDFLAAWRVSKMDAMLWGVAFISTIVLDVDLGLLCGLLASILAVVIRSIRPPVSVLGQVPDSELYADVEHYNARQIPGLIVLRLGGAVHFANRDYIKKSLWAKLIRFQSVSATPDKHYVVLDCSPVGFLDMSGVDLLAEFVSEAEEENTAILLASCSVAMMDMLVKSGFHDKVPGCKLFPSTHDAVTHAQCRLAKSLI